MSFLLLRRDGDVVALISETVFEARSDALAEVERVSGEGELDAAEVLIVDLNMATPVLIVAQAPASPSGEPPADTPDEPVEYEIEDAIADAIIADADVVQSLETETPEEPEAPEEVAEAPEEAVELPEEVAEEPEAPEEADALEEVALEIDEPEAVGQATSDEQPVESEVSTGKSEPEPEPAVQSWPWDSTPVSAPPEPNVAEIVDVPEEPAGEEHAPPEDVAGVLADLEEIVPTVDEPADSARTADEEPPASGDPPKAYEAGASDITTLTCEDCVYLNTCPKKGESDPSSCGSFQWRSA